MLRHVAFVHWPKHHRRLLQIAVLACPSMLLCPPCIQLLNHTWLDGEFPRPLTCSGLVASSVGFVDMRNLGHQRVVGVGIGKHRADREEDFVR